MTGAARRWRDEPVDGAATERGHVSSESWAGRVTVPAGESDSMRRRVAARIAGAAAMLMSGWAIGLSLRGSATSLTMVIVGAVGLLWSIGAGVAVHRSPTRWNATALALAAVVAMGALSWSANGSTRLSGLASVLCDAGERFALCLTPILVLHLLLTLPDGRLAGTGSRRVLIGAYGTAVVLALALLGDRDTVNRWPIVALWITTFGALPAAHASYRAASVLTQRRLQWTGWGAVVALEIALVAGALTLALGWPHHAAGVALVASGLLPMSIAAGTFPRLLSRIDRLLTHTVSVTGLTVLIAAAYLLALAAFGRRPSGSERSLFMLSMAAAAGAALCYQPARAWLGDRANRVVYGERVSPDEALRTWSSRLSRAIPLDELLLQLAETLRKSLQLRSAQVWTGSDGHYEVAAMVPHRPTTPLAVGEKERAVVSRAGVSGGTWLDIWLSGLVGSDVTGSTRVAPIAHSGEMLGLIVCERSSDAASFTDEDDRVLTELARQVGLALHNVQLDTALQASLDELRRTNDELRASRIRIVAAGDTERRKLERNLHDGAQQHLVALAVKLRLAKDAVVDDPADAEAMIDEIRGNLQEAITELRSLAHGIFPPLLVSGGLGEALPAAAARAALPTIAEVNVGRHPQEVEAAIYFCCMEALQNAGKHAGDNASVLVRVWEEPRSLHWEVSDDGQGFDQTEGAGDGHGFANMRDRMGAFGGTVTVVSVRGQGTSIHGSAPLM